MACIWRAVVAACSFEQDSEQPLLVLEDFDARSLALHLVDGTLPFAGDAPLGVDGLTGFLHLAIQIARNLGQLHALHIIHHNISPSNIVYNAQTQQVKLIDFGLATTPVYQQASTSRTSRGAHFVPEIRFSGAGWPAQPFCRPSQ